MRIGLAACLVALTACDLPPARLAASSSQIDTLAPSWDMPLTPALVPAARAIDQGLAWRATLDLAPMVADHTTRSDEAVLLAARAAGAWGGWSEVTALLEGHSWRGKVPPEATRLLTRAALASGSTLNALRLARQEISLAGNSADSVVALVHLGRAYEALSYDDSAAAALEAAAGYLPQIGDWLRLHAAGMDPDAGRRTAVLDSITLPGARARVPLVAARAWIKQGDSAAAAIAYRAAGFPATAWSIGLELAANAEDSLTIRDSLTWLVTTHPDHVELSQALTTLARLRPLDPETELAMARVAHDRGLLAAAQASYRRSLDSGLGSEEDRYRYAMALAQLGFHRAAASGFASITADSSLAARAGYQEALVRLRGRLGGVRRRLAALEQKYPLSEAAMQATLLRADLSSDGNREQQAREILLAGVARAPLTELTTVARYRAALIAYGKGDMAQAAAELDRLVYLHPESDLLPAALYWSGRSFARLGDVEAAKLRWQAGLRLDSTGYYGSLARKRLGFPPLPVPEGPAVLVSQEVKAALRRRRLLLDLGMATEARLEEAALIASAGDDAVQLLEIATAFREEGLAAPALRLAAKASRLGAERNRTLLTLLYPVIRQDALYHLARERDLDPALVAGLIRQESSFDPSATSRAGARGLMQIMPVTGGQIARRNRYPVWDAVLLYEPDVSLEMGTDHLATLIDRYGDPNFVLAAYNAGGSRVGRWRRQRAGTEDPEFFVERIPYRETRNYVKIVQQNAEAYRGIYGW